MSFNDWSTTAGSNVTVGGVSIAEGMSPGGVNNAIRGAMAELAVYRDLLGGKVISAGTADAQTVTTGMSMGAYAQGVLMGFKAGAGLTNTGAMTINVDGLGAKSVKLTTGANPPAGAVTAGGIYLIAYEATSNTLLLLNPALDADLAVLGGLAKTDGNFIVGDGTNWTAESGATARTSLGMSADGSSLVSAANYAAMRTLLDLEVGIDFPALAHNHSAADITSGTLIHERGGLERDVSSDDGIPRVSGGATTIVPYIPSTPFTPAFASTGATFNYAANGQVGVYEKIGPLIFFTIVLSLATSGNTLSANALSITGLPVASANVTNQLYRYGITWIGSSTSYITLTAALAANSSTLLIFGQTAAGTSSAATVNSNAGLHATSGTIFEITGCYLAAS